MTCNSPKSLAILAFNLKEEYCMASLARTIVPGTSSPRSGIVWSPPSSGFVKVNVDVAWSHIGRIVVSSCVARDDLGNVLCCASRKDNFADSVLHGELLALRFGCELVLFQNLQQVLLETDSLLAVTEVRKADKTLCQ
ncbi:hypothetical protein PTKIN_Ptkin02bG0085900 [Pterospermum kingtungense]